MRIISGKYRRRKLLANPGQTTRPIIDRVKVALFDRLEEKLQGAAVADIFAGTGSFGLEALSRGGRLAVFIEQDHRAWELLKQNVESLKAEEETLCWRTNALRSSFKPKGLNDWSPYDIVFFDPPYRFMEGADETSEPYKALTRLARADVTADDALLVIRTGGKAEFAVPPEWTLQECLKPSSMALHFFVKSTVPQAPDTAQE